MSVMSIIFVIGAAFSPNYPLFAVMRLLSGFTNIGAYTTGFVLCKC